MNFGGHYSTHYTSLKSFNILIQTYQIRKKYNRTYLKKKNHTNYMATILEDLLQSYYFFSFPIAWLFLLFGIFDALNIQPDSTKPLQNKLCFLYFSHHE